MGSKKHEALCVIVPVGASEVQEVLCHYTSSRDRLTECQGADERKTFQII